VSILPIILAVVIALLSGLVIVCTLVFLLAAGANASPAQVRELQVMCASLVIVGVLALAASIALMVFNRPWWSVAAAGLPTLASVILLIVLTIHSDRSAQPPPEGFMTPRQRALAQESTMPSDKLREHNARKQGERDAFLARVEAMEREGDLKAMEDAIMKRDNSLWSCCHVAEMYRQRMLRLKQAGDIAGAEDAFARSYDWMCNFASGATSGGEGAANSLARDEHLDQLIRDLGYKPSSVTPWNA
jgi:hypothetical protein